MLHRILSEALSFDLIDRSDEAPYRGRIDRFDDGEVSGWCVNLREPAELLTAELSFHGKVVSTSGCNLLRPDIEQAIGAPCRPGFQFSWASCRLDPRDVGEVSARILQTASEPAEIAINVLVAGRALGCLRLPDQYGLTNIDVFRKVSPLFSVVTMSSKLPSAEQAEEVRSKADAEPHERYRGYVENVDASGFKGWCFDVANSHESAVIRLSILGLDIVEVSTAFPRPDIEARYGFCGFPGFQIFWSELALEADVVAALEALSQGPIRDQLTPCWTVYNDNQPVCQIPCNPNRGGNADIIGFLKSGLNKPIDATAAAKPADALASADLALATFSETKDLVLKFRPTLALIFDEMWYVSACQDKDSSVPTPFDHFLTKGIFQNVSPCAVFSVKLYLSQRQVPAGMPAILHYLQHPESNANPHQLLSAAHLRRQLGDTKPLRTVLEDYIVGGWMSEADPHPLFDQKWYSARYKKNGTGRTPLEDYLASVQHAARNPHPLFDCDWYRARYPDVARANLDPLEHFIRFGAAELRDPNVLFDSKFYRTAYQHDETTEEPPFFHYLRVGQGQDLATHWFIDPVWVRAQLDRLGYSDGLLSALLHRCEALSLDPNPCFSVMFYLRRYPEIAVRRIHPLVHYLQHGSKERRAPHPLFWPEWFCASAGDRISEADPLRSYISDPDLFDLAPNPYFDPAFYRSGLADPGISVNPLVHFIVHSASGSPSPNPGLDMPWVIETYRLQMASLRTDSLSFILTHRNGFVHANPDKKPLQLVPGADASQVAKLQVRQLGTAAAQVRRRCIVYLSHNLKIQGAQTSLFELAIGMARDPANDVVVLAPDEGPMQARYRAAGIPVHKYMLPVYGMADEKHYAKLQDKFRQQIKSLGPDILHGNTVQAYHGIALAARSGIPAIWNIRESEDPSTHFSPLKEGAQKLLAEAIASPVEFVFVSRATESIWKTAYPKIKHSCINNGINYSNFLANSRNVSRPVARAQFGLRDDEVVLLNVGTWTERKGQRDIFQAITKIDRRLWPRLKVLLIGRNAGSYSKLLMQDFSGLPRALRDRFIICDESASAAERTLVLGAFHAADVFVFPSRMESYPRVVNEALYFGLPIISTSCFGVLEQLEPGVSGLLYNAGDISGLARHLEELTISASRRLEMSHRARNRALHGVMQYEEMLARYVSAYGRLILN